MHPIQQPSPKTLNPLASSWHPTLDRYYHDEAELTVEIIRNYLELTFCHFMNELPESERPLLVGSQALNNYFNEILGQEYEKYKEERPICFPSRLRSDIDLYDIQHATESVRGKLDSQVTQ